MPRVLAVGFESCATACRSSADQFEPLFVPRLKRNRDTGPHQNNVGDLDTAEQQRQQAQPRRHALRRQRWAAAVVAEYDIRKADRVGRKY